MMTVSSTTWTTMASTTLPPAKYSSAATVLMSKTVHLCATHPNYQILRLKLLRYYLIVCFVQLIILFP